MRPRLVSAVTSRSVKAEPVPIKRALSVSDALKGSPALRDDARCPILAETRDQPALEGENGYFAHALADPLGQVIKLSLPFSYCRCAVKIQVK
jgi:hypothetical protein